MAENSNRELQLIPSKKRRWNELYREVTSICESTDTLEITLIPGSNLEYNEEAVFEHGFPSVHQTMDPCGTILFPDSNLNYNEEAVVELGMSFVHQYCHQLLKKSQLWYLEEANIYIMPDYKINQG